MTRKLPWLVALAAVTVAVGSVGRGPIADARAQDLDGAAMLCRTFKAPLDEGPPLDTSDRTGEVGRWVADQAGRGWRLDGVDWEIASRPSGYPQAYVHVCLRR